MEGKPNVWETLRDVSIALVVTILVTLVFVGIFYSIAEVDLILLSVVIGVLIIVVICAVVHKFYALLNKIYEKLDSFDLPTKPQEETKEESNSVQEQPEEEKNTHKESELEQ